VKLSTQLGGQTGDQPEIWVGHGPPVSPLESPLKTGHECGAPYAVTFSHVSWQSLTETFT